MRVKIRYTLTYYKPHEQAVYLLSGERVRVKKTKEIKKKKIIKDKYVKGII